ncbi:MAG: VanZ family protein, partial [bacterium]|nr:VanZ family protein [bacterium]
MNLNNNKSKSIYLSIIICLLYAISDEFHQSFVPGRSCQLYD